MSAMRSLSRRYLPAVVTEHWPEIAWGLYAFANVVAIVMVVDGGETIPFHFIWLSLTIVYGYRIWGLRATLLTLAVVCVVGGGALAYNLAATDGHFDELAEVPMMAAMFLAMVWHAQRRQAAVEKLHRSAMRERDFARDASHQLRTPISLARGHAELIQLHSSDPQVTDDTNVILEELGRLGRISDRMLILAMADHRDFLAPAPVDLKRLIEETTRRWAAAEDREWEVRAPSDRTLVGDRDRIEAALDALIENAVKATEHGSRITVELRPNGRTTTVEVSDRGVGIPPEDLDRVFDRFWHASRSKPGAKKGTGLGLATVKAIAEAHGGFASAAPRREGGTSVRMVLADCKAPPEPQGAFGESD